MSYFMGEFSIAYLGKTYPGYNKPIDSDKAGKKKMVLAKVGDKVKKLYFGNSSYQDFRQHKDPKRRKNYLTRSAGIKDKNGNLTKNNKLSSNYWSRKILWMFYFLTFIPLGMFVNTFGYFC